MQPTDAVPFLTSTFPTERLLALYQQALGHDLPNKLVALQGIARLVGEVPSAGIDPETIHCLERLAILSRQIHGQISALADVGRSLRRGGPVTTLALDELWNEVTREVQCKNGQKSVRFEQSPNLPSLQLPQRSAHRLLLELVVLLVRRSPQNRTMLLTMQGSRDESGRVTLLLLSDASPPSASESETAFDPNLEAQEGPLLGPFLARLLVEGWGGSLRLMTSPEGGCLLRLEVPQPILWVEPGS